MSRREPKDWPSEGYGGWEGQAGSLHHNTAVPHSDMSAKSQQ